MDAVVILYGCQERLNSGIELFHNAFGLLLLTGSNKRTEHGIESAIEGRTSHFDKGSQSSSVESGNGLSDKCRDKDRENTVGTDLP